MANKNSNTTFYGTGRRKSSVARVRILPGKGEITINGKTLDEYATTDVTKIIIKQPLVVTNNEGKFDMIVKVIGGGLSGQAGAIRHGLSRALVKANEESYNIYNDVPNLMENIKKDIEVKEEYVKDTIEISKDKVKEVSDKLNNYNIFEEKPNIIKYNSNDAPDSDGKVIRYETEVKEQPKQDKPNVNVDPDKIVIDSNTISDDAFFDDFFGDDE